MTLSSRELVSHMGRASVGMDSLVFSDPRRLSASLLDVGTWRTGQATTDRRVTVGPSLNRRMNKLQRNARAVSADRLRCCRHARESS